MHDRARDPREIIRDEMLMRDRLLAALREGPLTVPEIAAAMGSPVNEVMYWVMAARRYGYVEESVEPTEDDYYQYALVKKEDRGDGDGRG